MNTTSIFDIKCCVGAQNDSLSRTHPACCDDESACKVGSLIPRVCETMTRIGI